MSNRAQSDVEATVKTSITPFRGRFDAQAMSLPADSATPLLGRERELHTACDLIRDDAVRLLTITGPGGIGKTRLAIRLAYLLRDELDDGAAFVSLATVVDPAVVVTTIAQAFRIRESSNLTIRKQVELALANRRLLLVLDNLEQVRDAGPDIARLLLACPELKILATSRVPLHISGEQEFALPPLAIPEADMVTPDDLARFPAVALFTQRARAVKADFALSDMNGAAVAAICRRLDGLPLAIELAAARAKVLSPHALLARLGTGIDVLSGGPRDQPARLQTLRAAISWSYDLLSSDERAIFDQLAVFIGGFSLDTAQVVVQAREAAPLPILDLLTSLVDSSLLRSHDDPRGEPRFDMLATVREFAVERLQASNDADALRSRHAGYFVALAEEAWPSFVSRIALEPWIERFETEHDNLRTALTWLSEHDKSLALWLAGHLSWFWYLRGHLAEGRDWLERTLTHQAAAGTEDQALALYGLAVIAHWQGDDGRAQVALEQALPIWEAIGNQWGATVTLGMLGTVAEDQGDYDAALPWYRKGLDLAQAACDKPNLGLMLDHLGIVNLGQGDVDEAVSPLEEALALQQEIGDDWGAAITYSFLGLVACERGEFERAGEFLRQSLKLRLQIGNKKDLPHCIANLATLAAAQGDLARAARLFGAAEAMQHALGHTMKEPELSIYRRAEATVRAKLDAGRHSAATDAGRALSLENAIDEALTETTRPAQTKSGRASEDLTPREHDVLVLLVKGHTDREIADVLFISPRTAQGHVARLFDKLGVSTRTAAVATALQTGLVDEFASRP